MFQALTRKPEPKENPRTPKAEEKNLSTFLSALTSPGGEDAVVLGGLEGLHVPQDALPDGIRQIAECLHEFFLIVVLYGLGHALEDLRALFLDAPGGGAKWGPIDKKITEELSANFIELDLTLASLTAFLPVNRYMLDLGPVWLDRYVRELLSHRQQNAADGPALAVRAFGEGGQQGAVGGGGQVRDRHGLTETPASESAGGGDAPSGGNS